MDTLERLFNSRKVLFAAFAVVQTIVLYYLDVPPQIWGSIDAFMTLLIVTITIEDAAEKRASGIDVAHYRMSMDAKIREEKRRRARHK